MEQSKQAKERLEAVKSKGGKEWTEALQEELDNTVLGLVDLEEAIEERKAQKKVETTSGEYKAAPGTEKLLHLSVVRGRRFNPRTGKEETKPYTQFFTYGEWQVFKQNYKLLGYTILAVLHDPFGGVEADKL